MRRLKRLEISDEQRAYYEKQKAEDEAWLFERTWRKPTPGEFQIISGRREFKARSLDHRPIMLTFRWRTSHAKECLGRNPAHRVGLWANKRLSAHYYGWDYSFSQPALGDDDSGIEIPVDLWGAGLAFWLEKTFQRELVKMEPAAVWNAQNRPGTHVTEEGWDGLGVLHYCDQGRGQFYPDPCIVRTVWPNGSRYAQLRNFWNVKQVVEFAWEKLHIDIRPA